MRFIKRFRQRPVQHVGDDELGHLDHIVREVVTLLVLVIRFARLAEQLSAQIEGILDICHYAAVRLDLHIDCDIHLPPTFVCLEDMVGPGLNKASRADIDGRKVGWHDHILLNQRRFDTVKHRLV